MVPEQQATPDVSYAYKASLIGSAHRFDIRDEGLSWKVGSRSGLWRYDDIAAIVLSYRPMSMQPQRFRADLRHRDGSRISVMSVTWQTAALMLRQDDEYRTFIGELHRRVAAAGARAALVAGLTPVLYFAGLGVLAFLSVAMAGLLVRALAIGEWAGALFIVGLAALFGWQIGGFMRRNQPRTYTFDALPANLLP
ncbi:MAG: hypothetical protein JSS22_17200 [Proteobacteria bacterium]|nr:hypothetical protein [Pseudomonadota bacterium]